jgi:Copper chaperone
MKTTVNIQNLKCHGCANTITKRLSELEDVTNVVVSNNDDSVTFEYTQDATVEKATKLLSQLGYPITGEDNSLGKKAKSL